MESPTHTECSDDHSRQDYNRFGPRHVYSMLLMIAGILCLAFGSAQNYTQLALARLLMGFVGAGFVIGIRLIGEWFPARQVGLAEGIYGGWGNFGSAAAAMTLPTPQSLANLEIEHLLVTALEGCHIKMLPFTE